MQRRSIRRNRRRFLKQAGLMTGTGALLAVLSRPGLPADNNAAATRPRAGKGYRLTAHIRSYYQKAGL